MMQPPFRKKQRGFIFIFPPAVAAAGGTQSNATFVSVTTTGAGSVTSPSWAQAIEIILQAAGGGSINAGTGVNGPRSGGGSGEYTRRTIPCTPGTLYNFSVGASAVATDGGDTTFTGDTTVWTAKGGKAGSTASGGAGGGRLGPAGGASGSGAGAGGLGNPAVAEGLESYSGASGGGSGGNTGAGAVGGSCEENAGGLAGAGTGAGGGGGASKFGPGGNGGANGVAGGAPLATSYGAGAGGPGLGAGVAGAAGGKGLLMYRFI